MIYMDNAATTLQKPEEVKEAILYALEHMGNAGRGGTEAALDASRSIYAVREKLADFFHAESSTRIAFTANSTESLNIALKGLFQPGDHVITTVLKRVGQIASEKHILFVVDASQTAGVYPIDVQELGVDVLCFTGHKGLLGPQGTGGLYVREGVEIRPLLCGGSGVDTYNMHHPSQMPTALEAGTLNGHGIAGLGAAIDYLNRTGIDVIREKELHLMRRFYDGISQLPDVKVYGDFTAEERAPIVTFNLGDYDSSEVSDELNEVYGIATRPGAHCAPLMHKALGTVEQGAVRFSFSHYNTEEEVDFAIRAIKEL